jgi:Ca2+-binding EF-hand superfamily protein
MHRRAFLGAAALAWLPALVPRARAQTGAANAFLQKWDADHDGTLSLAEVKSAASARFDKLDADHDGTLSLKELGGRVTASEFASADKDHDGTLSRAEYLTLAGQLFQAANPDKDGTIDANELATPAGRRLMLLLQ